MKKTKQDPDQLSLFEPAPALVAILSAHDTLRIQRLEAKAMRISLLATKTTLNRRELSTLEAVPVRDMDAAWESCSSKLKTWKEELNIDSVTFYRILCEWARTRKTA